MSASKRSSLKTLLLIAGAVLAGAAAAVAILAATGMVSLSTTAEGGDAAEPSSGLWTCGMHPEVLQEEPGICPICQMDLVPLRQAEEDDEKAAQSGEPTWTCPMHPTVAEPEPGDCPICGMELVREEHEHEEAGESDKPAVTIDPVTVQNMNVRTEPVRRRDLSRSIRTVGHLDWNLDKMIIVTTRYTGFIESAAIEQVGERVRKGEPLVEVYAPELVQTQQELLAAAAYVRRLSDAGDAQALQRAEALLEAARQRLAFWKVSSEQVAEIERTGTVLETVTIAAPIDGVIMYRPHGLEGMKVSPGDEIVHVADTSTLWLEVELYDHQLPWLNENEPATVTFDHLPGATITAQIHTVQPEVSPETRTVQLTLEVPNPDRRLKVGMYGTVRFEPIAAQDALAVPSQAVIRTGERNIVVVALGDGRFQPKEVSLGVESDGFVQIVEGVTADDRIVTSAQFMIDSESNLRAAVQRMVAERSARSHQH